MLSHHKPHSALSRPYKSQNDTSLLVDINKQKSNLSGELQPY